MCTENAASRVFLLFIIIENVLIISFNLFCFCLNTHINTYIHNRMTIYRDEFKFGVIILCVITWSNLITLFIIISILFYSVYKM